MILDITQGIVNAVISVIAFLFSFVLDLVFGLFGEITLPGFSSYSSYLISFWNLVFDFDNQPINILTIEIIGLYVNLIINIEDIKVIEKLSITNTLLNQPKKSKTKFQKLIK